MWPLRAGPAALLLAMAALLSAQSPAGGSFDPGPLVLDAATGISVPAGWRVTELFQTTSVTTQPADLVVGANGDLYFSRYAGSGCGPSTTSPVWRVDPSGGAPGMPPPIALHSTSAAPGHWMALDSTTDDIFICGNCNLTTTVHRVDTSGQVSVVNQVPVNDPDNVQWGFAPGASGPSLFVCGQDLLAEMDPVSGSWTALPVNLQGLGVSSLGNWSANWDPMARVLIGTPQGANATVLVDVVTGATTPIGPPGLRLLHVDARGIRYFTDFSGRVGVLDASGTPGFVPFIEGLTSGFPGIPILEAGPEGSLCLLDGGAATVYRLDPPLRTDTLELSAGAGGLVDFALAFEVMSAGRPYQMVVSASGATPGVLVGALTVPLNPDALTLAFLGFPAPIPGFPGWSGALDSNGAGTAQATIPAGVVPPGTSLHFTCVLPDLAVPSNLDASNATWIHLVP